MAVDKLIGLVMAEANPVIDPADTLEDRCRKAMKACYRHWMVTDEDAQFKGAVAAVYVATDDPEEKRRIEDELNNLRDLAALLSGVPIDIEQVKPLTHPIGLRVMWQEVIGQRGQAEPMTERTESDGQDDG